MKQGKDPDRGSQRGVRARAPRDAQQGGRGPQARDRSGHRTHHEGTQEDDRECHPSLLLSPFHVFLDLTHK